jgi:hypothetical protein
MRPAMLSGKACNCFLLKRCRARWNMLGDIKTDAQP